MKYVLNKGEKRVKVRYNIPGLERTRNTTPTQWDFMVALAKRWKLPFDFEVRGEWRHIVPRGIVLNATNINRYQQLRTEKVAYEKQMEMVQSSITAVTRQLQDRPRFQVLGQEVVERFVSTLSSWEEVLESGLPGKELSGTAPRFTVPREARMGLRLQPVRLRKFVAGKEFWGISPPMPFVLFADHLMAQQNGHPHVYAAELKLCVGDAKFDYGNPFQAIGTLREWYVGYNPRDVADKDWITHSRMWWRAHADAYFANGNTWVIEGPDRQREYSQLVELSREEVERFCSAKGWVPEAAHAPPEEEVVPPEEPLVARDRWADTTWTSLRSLSNYDTLCSVDGHAGARARLQGRSNTTGADVELYLCACHLAELNFAEEGSALMIQPQRSARRPPEAVEMVCEANSIITGNPVGTLPATHLLVGGAAVCAGHARYISSDMDVPARADPIQELVQLVLSGEMGPGRRQNQMALTAQFGNCAQGWLTPCSLCGEVLDVHWGLACPKTAPYRLAPDHELNRQETILWSRYDFDAAHMGPVWKEVDSLKKHFEKDRKEKGGTDRGKSSYENMVRMLSASDGSPMDNDGGRREFWVIDTLRKFGRDVNAATRCVDCGGTWKDSHLGPDCL